MSAFRLVRSLALALLLLVPPPALASQATIVGPIVGPHNMADVMGTINAAFLAIQGCNSGTSAPANGPSSAPVAYQFWCDTTTNPVLVKMYDGASWITLGALNTSTHAWTPYSAGGALTIGTTVQAYDADLAALAGLTSANNKCFYWTGSGTAANFDCSSFGRSVANVADAAALRTLSGSVIGTDVQAFDSDLSALAANATNGMWARTGSGTGSARTITGPAAGIAVSNGDGVSGNPTLALANDLSALEALSSTGLAARTGTDTWAQRTITGPAAGIAVSNGDGVSGNPTLALANDLSALEALSGTGLAARTGTDTWAQRAITAPAAGITVSNGDGVSGNPTLALANDLSAVEGLGCTGVAIRSATDTWLCRTLGGTANEITVANGDGVSGAPTLSLPSALTFTGKTITGGTFSGPTITGLADVQGTAKLSGFVTSTQITSNQNDYTATDGSNTCTAKLTLRVSSNASRNVSGLSCSQAEGDLRIVHNVGSFNVVLTNQDTNSTASNRFLFGGDITLTPDTSVTIRYDGVGSRWRAITTASSGGGGGVTSVGIAAGTGVSTSGTCTITTSGTCTVGLTTPVAPANGGSGVASPTANTIPINQGSSAQTNTGTGTKGQALISGGLGADPAFKSGARVLLNTLTASNSANLQDTSSITSAYNEYELVFENIVSATNAVGLQLQIHTAGGYQSSGYKAVIFFHTGVSPAQASSTTGFLLTGAGRVDNTTPGVSGTIRFYAPTNASVKHNITGHMTYPQSSAGEGAMPSGYYDTAVAFDGFQVLFSSGNIASGVIKIYGML